MADLGCVFCGGPTGSREHTLPASLGGRRVNKGILCDQCNSGFSDLDNELAQQLEILNGLLGVRPDRWDGAKPARAAEPVSGNPIHIKGSRVEFGGPVIKKDETKDGRRVIEAHFGSEEQAREFLANLKKEGGSVVIQRGEPGIRFFTNPVHLKWTFGGEKGFREVGRICLNFLAHHFPLVARDPGLLPFKEYVLGKRPGEFVWYDTKGIAPDHPRPFVFGHRILVAVDAASSSAWARISFFGSFDLAVTFGPVATTSSSTAVTDIDPLAEKPPLDIATKMFPVAIYPVLPRDVPLDQPAWYQASVGNLMARVMDHYWDQAARTLVPALNALRAVPPAQRMPAIRKVLETEKQRLLNVTQVAVQELAAAIRQTPGVPAELAGIVAGIFEGTVEGDDAQDTGLSLEAESSLELALTAIASSIGRELQAGELSSETLRLYLEGGKGAAAAGQTLSGILLPQLEAFARQRFQGPPTEPEE